MGKETKERTKAPRHRPLGDDIAAAESAGVRTHARRKQRRNDEEAQQSEDVVSASMSKKILQQAREQQEEEEQEMAGSASSGVQRSKALPKTATAGGKGRKWGKGSSGGGFDDDDDDDDDDLGNEADDFDFQHQDADYAELDLTEEDEAAMRAFMPSEAPQRLTLADIIMSKIREKKTEVASRMSEGPAMPPVDPKVVQVYRSVGEILSRYRSGRLPKALKIIPNLHNWEEILYITEPDTWTAAAMYAATRLFASNLNTKMAQRFYNLVLLPRIRDDIAEYKRLNFHLYMALKKALFKPAAFFRGILLPLCEDGTCTLREAVVVGSVVARRHIPVLHSSAAILKLAEMPYSGANSVFLRILLNKKYSLPYRVIDAVVHHFYRFASDTRELPVLWHQSLLVFVQRYKTDISDEQREALMTVIREKFHSKITPEIRRELISSRDM